MRFCLIGGDRRTAFAAEALRLRGHSAHIFGGGEPCFLTEAVKESDGVVLPLPVSRDGVHLNAPALSRPLSLERLFAAVPASTVVLGGRLSPAVRRAAQGQRLIDYEAEEIFRLCNAQISAKATLSLLYDTLGTHSVPPCLLLGSGRFAEALADLFRNLQIPFSVYARNQNRVLAGRVVPQPLTALGEAMGTHAVILNTVPAPILPADVLAAAQTGTLLFELSAAPDVVSEEECRAAGVRLIRAPALPGRYFPLAAGEAVADAVLSLLSLRSAL